MNLSDEIIEEYGKEFLDTLKFGWEYHYTIKEIKVILKCSQETIIKLYRKLDIKLLKQNRFDHMILKNQEYKYCSKCKQWLLIKQFDGNKYSWDMLKNVCKKCDSKYRQTDEYKKQKKDYDADFRKNNPEQEHARHIVSHAIRAGVLKKEPCKICKSTENINAHHYDSKNEPYKILWLCSKHHNQLHKMVGALGGTWLTDHEIDIRELYKAKKREKNER